MASIRQEGQFNRLKKRFARRGDFAEPPGGVTALSAEDTTHLQGVRNFLVMERVANQDDVQLFADLQRDMIHELQRPVEFRGAVQVVHPVDALHVPRDAHPCRHLIKETLTDRDGDDIHESDTRQELMSLSARFGLTITFASPDRDRYLYIVGQLAKQYGLDMDERELNVRSEAFAIRMGGRSARVAKQFVELCKAGVQD